MWLRYVNSVALYAILGTYTRWVPLICFYVCFLQSFKSILTKLSVFLGGGYEIHTSGLESTIFLGCAAILAAAQPLKIVFVVVVVVVVVVVLCCVVAAKSTFTQGLLT